MSRTAVALLLALGCQQETEVGRFLAGSSTCEVRGVDPFQLAALGSDGRSHWLQPWRAYRDTWPASRMRQAPGLALGTGSTSAADVMTRARSMSEAGFRRTIIAMGWNSMSYDQPFAIDDADRAQLVRMLTAAKTYGLRPLMLLDANHIAPVPDRGLDVVLAAAAPKGARELRIDVASARQVAAGRTGLTFDSVKAAVLFHAIDVATGRVTLSRPLPEALPAGTQRAYVMRYPPFGRPRRADGSANPRFEEPLTGWLAYARAFATEARAVLESDAFDLEVWNELKQGSDFLDVNRYYETPIDDGPGDPEDVIPRAILQRTVEMVRDPRNGFPRAGVSDGFGNTRWQISGAAEPPGVTALSRHVSIPGLRFPEDAAALGGTPLDAQGRRSDWQPSYDASFPELPLSAIVPFAWTRPGQLTRDLAPFPTNDAAGTPHGRATQGPGGAPVEMWMTALSWSPSWARDRGVAIADTDIPHLQAKAALRSLAAYVGAGVTGLFFYAPSSSDSLRILDWAQPGGGPTGAVIARFLAAFAGPATVEAARSLNLVAVGACQSSRQFDGDGTAAHPPLLNRDVVAAFPFQVDARTFMVPVWVMTRNLAAVRQPAVSGPRRFDLPEEVYRLTFEGAAGVKVEGLDPLTGQASRAQVASAVGSSFVVEAALTDWPRLLKITLP